MSKRRPSGDGMVRKKEDGRWEGRIVIGHKENGDSIFRYIYAPTQKELTAKLRQEITAYQGVDLTEDSKLTLSEWLDYWLDAIMAGTIRPSTLNGYHRYADLYIKPYLGEKQISKITPADVQKMYATLKARGRVNEHPQYGHQLSGSMVHSIHTMFHEAMKAAEESHIIAKNPTENIPVPKANPKPKQILNDDQLERFMDAIKNDAVWHDFFYTELTTGLRRGELCGLMWADFDEVAGTLAVKRTIHMEKGGRLVAGATKTGRGTRNILLPASTAQLLAERKKHSWSEWIFPNPLKPESPTNPRSAYGHLKALLDSAGLPNIRFHDLSLTAVQSPKAVSGAAAHSTARACLWARWRRWKHSSRTASNRTMTFIFREREGHYPSRILADKIYRNRENLNYCKEHGIRLSGPALGRPQKGETRDKAQDYRDECERVEVERRFSLAKRKCGMGLVATKLWETATHVIAMSVLVLNLRKIQCALLRLLTYLLAIFPPKEKWTIVQ